MPDSQSQGQSSPAPAAPANPAPPSPPDRALPAPAPLWICLGLAALVFAAFWPVLGNDFISYDDPAYVTENPHTLAGLTADSIHWAFTTTYFGNWHPLTWLSHMLDVELFGKNAPLHHLDSLCLHAASVIFLFLALRRMTGATWQSAAAAALFAVHPLRVESIAWVSERKDVLSVFFSMIALHAYAGYTGGKSKWIYYAAALVAFALALMSKAMMVTLPFVLLLLDFWPLRRLTLAFSRASAGSIVRCVAEKIPFFLISVVMTVIGVRMLNLVGATNEGVRVSVAQKLTFAAHGYFGYIQKTVWPVNLYNPYLRPAHIPATEIIWVIAVLAAVSCLSLASLARRPYLAVGWFWFIGTLLPVSGYIRLGPQAFADRYTYFPSIGIGILAVWAVADYARERGWSRTILAWATTALLAVYVVGTYRQTMLWRNNETLFSHTTWLDPDNYIAHTALGLEYFKHGRVNEAVREALSATQENPAYDPAHSALGRFFAEEKNYPDAIRECEIALKQNPTDLKSLNNLGNLLLLQGQYQQAVERFTNVLRLDPNRPEAHNNLALAYMRLGRSAEAVPEFREAIRLKPQFTTALNNLAWLLATSPDPSVRDGNQALAFAAQACELTGYHSAQALATLAAAYAETGQYGEAIAAARQAQAQAGPTPGPLNHRIAAMIEAFYAKHPYRAKPDEKVE